MPVLHPRRPRAAAIVFDLDGTLTDRPATVRAACGRLGHDALAERVLSVDPHGRLVGAAMRSLLGGHASPGQWRRAMVESTVPAAGLDVVRRLARRGRRLGLLSNGSPASQRAKLARLDLRFEAAVISGEVGVRKPDPAAFRLVLARLGVMPARAWMVGDDPDYDLAPARALGMTVLDASHLPHLEKLLAAGSKAG